MKVSSLTDSCILSCKNGNIYSAQQQYIEHLNHPSSVWGSEDTKANWRAVTIYILIDYHLYIWEENLIWIKNNGLVACTITGCQEGINVSDSEQRGQEGF